MDCEGTFSPCSSACEVAADRSFTETQAQRGDGKKCPVAEDCNPGVGECVGKHVQFTRQSREAN